MNRSVLLLLTAAATLACEGATAPADPASNGVGWLEVAVFVTGEDVDITGYTLTGTGPIGIHIGSIDTTIVLSKPVGEYHVRLKDIDGNCSVTSDRPQDVLVAVGDTSRLTLEVTCRAIAPLVNKIVYSRYEPGVGGERGLYHMNPNGTEVTRITGLFGPNIAAGLVSPDGKRILVEGWDSVQGIQVFLMNADNSGEYLLLSRVWGEPSWAPDGNRIVYVDAPGGHSTLGIMTLRGLTSEEFLGAHDAGEYRYPSWSPDGSKIAFSYSETSFFQGNADIYTVNVDGTGLQRLTDSPGNDVDAAWSPDGSKIAFVTKRDGNYEIYVMNADGSDQRNLTNHPNFDGSPTWSPDGLKIAFSSSRDGRYIYIMNAEDGGEVVNVTSSPWYVDVSPDWSKAPGN